MIPRIGSFEVTHNGIVIFSKLLSQMWPNYSSLAKRLAELFTDQRNGMPHVSMQVKYQTKGNDVRAPQARPRTTMKT